MSRRAGRRIGQGSDAFVVDPPIPCKGETGPRKGFVTRVPIAEGMSSPQWKLNPEIQKRLQELDPEQEYFYYPIECEPGDLTAENRADGITENMKPYAELLRYAPSGTWTDPSYRARTWKELFQGRKKQVLDSIARRTDAQKDHLLRAVALLHSKRITHGDLHPGNIVIAEDGLPRIIDFGLAKIVPENDLRYLQYELETLQNTLEGKTYTQTSRGGNRRKTRRRGPRSSRRGSRKT